MSLPTPKFAVYYGTIRLDTGTIVTYTAAQVAAFFNITGVPYISVPLIGPSPFHGGLDELSYYHLKPDPAGRYFDARELYNTNYDIQDQPDFYTRQGKWVIPKVIDTEFEP